jgi:hypothetical protein
MRGCIPVVEVARLPANLVVEVARLPAIARQLLLRKSATALRLIGAGIALLATRRRG